MKTIGTFLMVIGGIFLFWAMFLFDTSVSVPELGYGTRVNNLGLMDDKRNYITISGIMFAVGLILFLFDKNQENQETHKDEVEETNNKNQNEKIWVKSRDLNNDEYKIFLVKKYSIEKNNALEKIIADGKIFNSINDALVEMDEKDASNQNTYLNSTQGIADLPQNIQNEITVIAERLKNYKYTITKYDKNKGVWEVSSSGGKFDQNLDQLKSLLRNFEK